MTWNNLLKFYKADKDLKQRKEKINMFPSILYAFNHIPYGWKYRTKLPTKRQIHLLNFQACTE